MNNRLILLICMNAVLVFPETQAISPEVATVATGITTIGLAAGTYSFFKKRCKKSLERWGATLLVAAPLSYIASVLWFGLTPEMRYLFGTKTADSNRYKPYAIQQYKEIAALLEDLNGRYLTRMWLIDLHEDLTKALQRTERALRGWYTAQEETLVTEFPLIDAAAYERLKEQRACLEHNLFLLRSYRPFQEQHTAWLSCHRHHSIDY